MSLLGNVSPSTADSVRKLYHLTPGSEFKKFLANLHQVYCNGCAPFCFCVFVYFCIFVFAEKSRQMSLRDNFSPSTPDIVKEAKLLIHGSEVKYVLTNLHLSCRHLLSQHISFNWTIYKEQTVQELSLKLTPT